MRPEISDDEAIRTIVNEKSCGDYVDVANVVQERFGIRVGAARVEEVVTAMKQKTSAQHVASSANAETSQSRQDVLKFVEAMGGFEAARAAITDLEHSFKNLMK